MMEGRIQKTTMAGEATVESLDPDLVGKLLHYLDLSTLVSSCRQAGCSSNLRRCHGLMSADAAGARLHHAGGEEEPPAQRALPLSGPRGGGSGAY